MASKRRVPKFDSPRHLVLRHSHAQWSDNQSKNTLHLARRDVAGSTAEKPDDIPPPLDPGEEQLYSFYAPSLLSTRHHITVTQRVNPPADAPSDYLPIQLSSSQQFEVIGPRFSLPDNDIQTVYPPQGHGDHLRILPHMVFNDPHLPWERPASIHTETPVERNRVPWLALLVFTQDELRLTPSQLATLPSGATQSSTLSVNMTINDLWGMVTNKAVVSPIVQSEEDPITDDTAGTKYDFIFVPSDLFQSFVCTYDGDGKPVASQQHADVSRYKYLAHIRNINTTGMALAAGDQNEQGLYSVILAHRVGPWEIKQPTPVVVHLVSLEGVEGNIDLPVSKAAPLVGLCSLYSWTYQCLPPDSFNFYDAMKDLEQAIDCLRPPNSAFNDLVTSTDPVVHRMGQRMQDGYSLVRYRVQTGEETVALTRGPFVPTSVEHSLTFQSTFSTDLQILDQTLGIMDITYSSAWQLGKTMAIADQSFTAAVSRIRTTIHDRAMQAIKAKILTQSHRTTSDVVPNLPRRVQTLGALPSCNIGLSPLRKWKRNPPKEPPKMSFFSPVVRDDDNFFEEAKKVARSLASSTFTDKDHYFFYNEHNQPSSSDWALMLKWILDRMSFFGIPAHYLITDPSHLPRESLRFFTIDANWVDALVDGALSIANHLEQDDDSIRTAIKSTLTEYLDSVDPQIGFAPQVPKSGFLLRSSIVKQFPDLIVTAQRPESPLIQQKMAPLLRQENIDEEVMLVLFDRVPGDGLLTSLNLSQPPHQQCFAAAANVGPDENDPTKIVFELAYPKIYTVDDQPKGNERKEELGDFHWTRGQNPPCPIFDWAARTLIFPNFAENVRKFETDHMPSGQFNDDTPSAALVGIQLNDKMYQLLIEFPTASPGGPGLAAMSAKRKSTTLKMVQRKDRFQTARSITEQLEKNAARRATRVHSVSTPPILAQHRQGAHAPTGRPSPSIGSPSARSRPLGLPVSKSLALAVPPAGNIAPQFRIGCRPAGKPLAGAVPTLPVITTSMGFPIDLIFSVRNTGNAAALTKAGYLLTEVRLIIPMGNTSAPGHLFAPEAAPNLSRRMLSNLRWNPLLVPGGEDEPDVLLVQLLPRSTSGAETPLRSQEMSFLLGQVAVNAYKVGFQMMIRAFEIYDLGGKKVSIENTSCRFLMQPGV